MSRSAFLAALLASCIALTLFAGAPSLGGGFLNYDDPGMVVHNPRLDAPSASDVVGVFGETREHAYLPLYQLALMPEASAAGKDPRAFRLASLLWQAASACAAAGFVLALSGSRLAALFAGVVLACHPIVAESAGWISGRKDQVSLLLLIASAAAGLSHLRRGGVVALLGSVLFLALATLAKGTVVVAPLLFAATAAWVRTRPEGFSPRARPRTWLAATTCVAVAAATLHYLVARAEGAAATDPGAGGPAERALAFLVSVGRYAGHLLVPVRLSAHYDVRPEGFEPAAWAGLALLVAGAAAFARVVFGRRPASFVVFAGAWAWASLLVFNGVFPATSLAMADRYLIVAAPMVGAALGFALERLPRAPRVAVALLIVAGLVAAARPRYAEFRDSVSLFSSAEALDPLDPLPPLKLGEALREGPPRRPSEAAEKFVAAARLARDPVREARARVLAADALSEAGRFEESAAQHRALEALFAAHGAALRAHGLDDAAVRHNAAAADVAAGRLLDGRDKLQALLRDRPDYGPARLLKADLDRARAWEALAEAHDPARIDLAREALNRSIAELRETADAADRERRDRDASPEARASAAAVALKARGAAARTLARAPWRSNHLNEALAEAEALVRAFPDKAEAYLVRSDVLAEADPAHAAADVVKAAEVEPTNRPVLRLVAEFLRKRGDDVNALKLLLKVRELAPDDPETAAALAFHFTAAGRAHLERGGGRAALGNARTAAREALLHRPEDPAAWTLLGDVATAEKDDLAAASAYERALRADPSFAPARLALARRHQARGIALMMRRAESRSTSRPGESRPVPDGALDPAVEAEFRAALRYAPEAEELDFARNRIRFADRDRTVRPAVDRARNALRERRIDEALALADAAVRMDDAYALAHETLACAALAAGDHDRALEAFRRVLELDPRNPMALVESARLHWRRGDYDAAKARADAFLKLTERWGREDLVVEGRRTAEAIVEAWDARRKAR
ncbi:MAG TPA: tetratricopeptide repeat protein [Planctomycetota bacterium]|nr:tetratricopeptide repeat protein [Planctomycetota bacterium]